MHLTVKKEATKPAFFNFLQQQERFDQFIGVYNNVRPHQALNGAYPGDIYTRSARVYEPPHVLGAKTASMLFSGPLVHMMQPAQDRFRDEVFGQLSRRLVSVRTRRYLAKTSMRSPSIVVGDELSERSL